MKKKTIALLMGIVGSGVSGGLILGQILNVGLLSVGSVIFAGLKSAAVLTGFGLLAVSALLIGIGCYQLWKSRVKKQDASNEGLLNESSSKSESLNPQEASQDSNNIAAERPLINQIEAEEKNEGIEQKDRLTHLPRALLSHAFSFLDKASQGALTSSDKASYRFLEPSRMFAPLLRAVVNGNQERVIQILTRYPELVVRRGRVTDNSGRSFPRASAADLVRWCGDLRYMANAMLDVLLHLSDQKLAEQIRIKWVEQNASYEQQGGLVCVLPGRTEPEKPSLAFSLAPLLRELKAYVDNFDTMTWPQREAQWCTKVGAEQFLLTAIYLQHYCNPDVPFYPKPSFDKTTFPRVLKIYNYLTDAWQGVWDGRDGGSFLGRDFGILRGGAGAGGCARPRHVAIDLVALGACEERTRLDLDLFMGRLGKPLNQQLEVESKSSHCSIS